MIVGLSKPLSIWKVLKIGCGYVVDKSMRSVNKKSLGLRVEGMLVAWLKSASHCSEVGLDFLMVSGFSLRVFASRSIAGWTVWERWEWL